MAPSPPSPKAPAERDAQGFLFREAQNLAHLGSWEWDIRHDRVTWSEEMYRLYGYQPGEIPITFETYLQHVHPDDRGAVASAVTSAVERRGGFEHEERILRKDGTGRVLRSGGRIFLDGEGQPVRMIGICQDITAQKAAEAALIHAREELERRVTQRTQELAEAVASRDVFMSIASHELRTPLTALQLRFSTLERSLHRGTPPDAQALAELLRVAQRQVDRLNGLVEDLLDVSSIQARQLRLRLAPVDLAHLVREVAAHHAEQLTRAGSTLRLELDAALTGRWDAGRVEQILVNLFSNALKYAPGAPVEIRATQNAGVAELSFRDAGPGIPREVQASIFERYGRARGVAHVRGLGLGLYIVRHLVEQHGGTIELETAPGQGTRFRMRLPLEPGHGAPDEAAGL